MGRQIQICSTDDDNLAFEKFLKQNFDCKFFQSSAPTAEELEINSFAETSYPFSSQIFIWNKVFPWSPEHGQTKTKEQSYYLTNTSNAPLIEFCKTIPNHTENGRIYWAKYFTSGTILYDIVEFDNFYTYIVKWFIKNAVGKIKYGGINTYYLEDAWARKLSLTNKT